MNFSIITSVYNNLEMLKGAIDSVASQQVNGVQVEHVIVDGKSSDGTEDYLKNLNSSNIKFKSEPDKGVYDGLNKGLSRCTGDIIGILHSDDLFNDEKVLFDIQKLFLEGADVVYGDLLYVDRNTANSVIRNWKSGTFSELDLKMGWMPPHPTFFFRKKFVEEKGLFNLNYKIAADYDFMLRYLTDEKLKVAYCPRIITKMRVGGISNRSLKNIIRKSKEDMEVAGKYFDSPILTIFFKNMRKIKQLRMMTKIS